jgi:dipeptidyl aminopeptidase/acylaminoacyl peptidase
LQEHSRIGFICPADYSPMNKTATVLLLAGLLLAGCCRNPELSVREFFKSPESTEYRISPLGKQISFLKPSGKSGRLNIFVQPRDGGAARCVTFEEERDVWPRYFWKDEDHIVYFIRLVGNSCAEGHIRRVDLKSENGAAKDCTPCGYGGVISEMRGDPSKILVSAGGNAVKVDILAGTSEVVQSNPGNVLQWIPDQAGNILAAIARDGLDLCLLWRSNPTANFVRVKQMDFRQSISQLQYVFDEVEPTTQFQLLKSEAKGRFFEKPVLYALSNMRAAQPRDKWALVKIDPQTGDEIEECFANPDFDVAGMEVSPTGKLAAKFMTWRTERKCLDYAMASWYRQLEARFPDDDVEIKAYDDNETALIVKRSSDQNPGEFYLFEPASGNVKKLGECSPQLKGHLAPMKPISFVTRDNRLLCAYLTLPIGRKPANLPLVVIPHGGPWWRNVWGFTRENREVQFFAGRGYAVLQVNFRSSTGYGTNFWEAGFQQWGQAMQDDVTDGVLWAIREKIADRKRVAIVGESYGGYAALAGITVAGEFQYAAAIDRAGISDLVRLLEQYPDPQLRVEIGDPGHQLELLKRFSPALHCEKIGAHKTPLLIAHGSYDSTVSPEQSSEMCAALEQQGVHVQIHWFAENHIFENQENLIAYYDLVDAFLKKHLR